MPWINRTVAARGPIEARVLRRREDGECAELTPAVSDIGVLVRLMIDIGSTLQLCVCAAVPMAHASEVIDRQSGSISDIWFSDSC